MSCGFRIHVPDVRSISLPEVVLEESFHDVKMSTLDRFMAAVSGHKSIKVSCPFFLFTPSLMMNE